MLLLGHRNFGKFGFSSVCLDREGIKLVDDNVAQKVFLCYWSSSSSSSS